MFRTKPWQEDRVSPRHLLVDPLNRKKGWLNSTRVHELLFKVLSGGFSLLKNQVGISIDIPSGHLQDVVDHNTNMTKGDERFPASCTSDTPLYSVIHTNHFVMSCRCFLYRTKTIEPVQKLGVCDKDGRLSMAELEKVNKKMYDYSVGGVRVIRFSSDIRDHPALIEAICSSCNLDNTLGETEGELLSHAATLVWQGVGENGVPSEKHLANASKTLE